MREILSNLKLYEVPTLAGAAESQGHVEVAQSRTVPMLAGGPV